MLVIKGVVKNSYGQKTKNGTDFLVHEFEERGKVGQTIIQRVKDFQCLDIERGKEIEMPVFIVSFPLKNGDGAGHDLIRVHKDGIKDSKGGLKL